MTEKIRTLAQRRTSTGAIGEAIARADSDAATALFMLGATYRAQVNLTYTPAKGMEEQDHYKVMMRLNVVGIKRSSDGYSYPITEEGATLREVVTAIIQRVEKDLETHNIQPWD